MVLTSFRTDESIDLHPFEIGLKDLLLTQFFRLLTDPYFPFPKSMLNSIIVSLISSLMAIALGGLAAYSLGRLRYKGGSGIGLAIFATYLPPGLTLYPFARPGRAIGATFQQCVDVDAYFSHLSSSVHRLDTFQLFSGASARVGRGGPY